MATVHSPQAVTSTMAGASSPEVPTMGHDSCQTTADSYPKPSEWQTPQAQDPKIPACLSPMVTVSRQSLRPTALTSGLAVDSTQTSCQSPVVADANPSIRRSYLVSDENMTQCQSLTTSDAKSNHSQSRADYAVTRCPSSRADSRMLDNQDDARRRSDVIYGSTRIVSPKRQRQYPWDFTANDIRLATIAKMRGHKNLLSMETPPESFPSRQRVIYPRNSWFYYLDNALEDAAMKKDVNYHNSAVSGSQVGSLLTDSVSRPLPKEVRKLRAGVSCNGAASRRNEWFYHLDNLAEDAMKKEALCDQSRSNHGNEEDGQAPPPQSQGSCNQAERDLNGSVVAGNPIYARTPSLNYVSSTPPATPRRQQQQQHASSLHQTASGYRMRGEKVAPNPNPDSHQRIHSQAPSASMDMLMANAYQEKWLDENKKRGVMRPKLLAKTDLLSSEYKTSFGPALRTSQRVGRKWANVQSRWKLPTQKGAVLGQPRNPGNQAMGQSGGPGNRASERFVLSKFKKIRSKLDVVPRPTGSIKTVC